MRYLLTASASRLGCFIAATALAGCAQAAPPAPRVPQVMRAVSRPTAPAPALPSAPSATPSGEARRAAAGDSEPHARRSHLVMACTAARAFIGTYLRYLYGRLPARRVINASPRLRSQLQSGHAATTPAERSRLPRIVRLWLTPAGPPVSVIAVVVVRAQGGQVWRLTASLEPRGRTWRVVAVGG